MAKRRITWLAGAKLELNNILKYWKKANGSDSYSRKLLKLFKEEEVLILKFPYIGKKTNDPNVRQRIVRDYLLFYEITRTKIRILAVWDGRQDPKEKPIK
ncbi:MAG TPA: type II toxin-antitoxin system RelE/ParE family toxin [Chitinophagales bacterium]